MKNLKKFCLVVIYILLIGASAYSQNKENYKTIMDCASSAIVEKVHYSGNGDFSFVLKPSKIIKILQIKMNLEKENKLF